MDLTAITSRIAEIQGTVGALTPVLPSSSGLTSAGLTSASASASASAFGSALSTAVGQQASRTSGTAPTTSAGTVDPATLPVQRVGAYGPEQLANAAAIINAGKAMGLSVRDQTIGVMTAIGESSLRVVDHGDTAGPDSRGLFQQRGNGAWGSLADRMNPTASATSFFTALAGVQGRDAVAPTIVAHTVQRNADPQHYASSWDDAVAIVGALT